MKFSRNVTLTALAATALALTGGALATGCGGGSGQVSTKSSKPTTATRNRVTLLQSQSVRSLAQSGVQPASLAATRNSSYSTGTFPLPPAGFGGASWGNVTGYTSAVGAPSQYIAPYPMLGAFLRNIAAPPPAAPGASGTGSGSSGSSGTGSGSSGSSGPPPVAPLPTFYYDNFLGLWVAVQNTTTQITFTLYVDQAKTEAAGSITTILPTGNTYPQVFSSTYTFTAGLLSGSHGTYQTTLNQDGSGTSSYSDTYGDGSSDSGTSSWTGKGGFTWSDQTTNSTGAKTTSSGTFLANGSGTTHATTSDGLTLDYTYNADGSGSGRITGSAAGLPATVVWDVYGDTTITYADGTVDYTPGWLPGDVIPPTTNSTPPTTSSPPSTPAKTSSGGPPAPPTP